MGIEHWLACGADVRTGGRAVYGHVITKFSGMGRFTYPWCSAGGLPPPELRYYCVNNKMLEYDWFLTAHIYGLILLCNSKTVRFDLSDYQKLVIGQVKSDS